ncbi:hypothetical protein HYY27_08615 [bacterium]|nr:hypothetical protein [bacterium]
MRIIVRTTGGGVLTERTARWEQEVQVEERGETFGAEPQPTGNPIGGGEGYRDVLAGGDFVVLSLEALREALRGARAGQVVFVPGDAEIDMTDQPELPIRGGVTLASTRGRGGSEGALIFSNALDTPGMLATAGDCVRITGLRLRGPYPHRERIGLSANGVGTTHFGFEVDNCEVTGFSVAAIRVGQGASRAYVHHNFIHHNQQNGLGYGVSLGAGDVLVEANLFDWCRHHIASSGSPGSGYEARHNVCRPNANGHLFDMHGGRDRGDGTDIAGDWMNIHHNTFMSERLSVGIRGVPSQGARIHHNWFYNPDPANIVRTTGNTEVTRNTLGPERNLSLREG